MARMITEDGKPVRVFAHYVLGRLFFLFFLCHPGTLATCDGQAYLLNRYPNRDLVTAEGQMQDHRRHFTPRDPEDFSMKTGVPEDFLRGNADNWTPDWAVSLEERFHRTVKAWLRGPACVKQQAEDAVTKTAPPGFAFVPTVEIRAEIDMRIVRANGQHNRHWISIAGLQTRPCCHSRPSALMRRSMIHGHRCPGNSHQMLLGFGKRGFRFRRSIFSSPSVPNAGSNSEDNGEGEGDGKCDTRASVLGATDVSTRAKEMLEANSRTLEDHEPPHGAQGGLLSSLFGGVTDVYDSAISFVGCVLVTSPLGKRYLNAFDSHVSVPTSTTHRGGIESSSSGDGNEMNLNGSGSYEFVGFHNIDPFEASGRRGKRLPNYLLRY